jgi:polysaccharide deacetylase family protein (PEP-CTERM system associated)
MKNALCIDVDDLYWSLREASLTKAKESYFVDKETDQLLNFLDSAKINATFFIPGIFTKNSPSLVLEIYRRGHEIASHGTTHKKVRLYKANEFLECVSRSKETLEEISGQKVSIYKAPMWSLDKYTPWAYDTLIKAGYKIDHSAMPKFKKFLNKTASDLVPFYYLEELLVIPPTVYSILEGTAFPICGGFYNAYLPLRFQINYFKKLNREGLNFNYFFHPFEAFPSNENKRFFKKQGIYATLYAAHSGRHFRLINTLIDIFRFDTLTASYEKYVRH